MAFLYSGITLNRATTDAKAVQGVPTMHFYQSFDNEAAFLTAGYLNQVAANLAVNDLFYATLADRTNIYHVTAVTPNVVVADGP